MIFLVALLVLLGIVAITLTQYGPTRQLGVEMGLDALNESIDGNVTVGSVNGDLLTGLELRDVTLAAPDGEFARVPRILLRYDPVGILQQKEVVATLLIDNPEVSLIRSSDGLWNIDAFIGPQPESPPEPRSRLDWIFDVSSVEIRDGRLSVRDYSRISRPVTGDPASSPIAFDPLDAEFDGIFLEAATYFSEERQSLLIRRLGFREQKSDLRLLDIVGRIDLDGNDGLRIDDLIVETEGSYLELSGRFDTPGLFDTTFASALPLANMSVDLRAERVSTDELGRLIPATTFLAGDPALTLSASGNLDSLLVEKLDLTVGDSRLNLTGTLDDLSDPDRWSIEAEISESSLRLADVRATLPEIDFSSVGFVEHVDIERLTYSGTPQDLTTTFDLATNVGSLYGGGVLGFGNGGVWRADASANELDLDAVSSGSLTGDVNGRFVAEGTGFSLEDLTARLRARLTSSRIAGREVSGAWIDGSFGEGGLVTVDTAVIGFGGGSSAGIDRPDLDELAESLDNVRVRTDLAVLTDGFVLGSAVDDAFASNPSVRLSGWLRTGENPSYRAFVETDRFNAADVTLDQNHNSRLGFVAEIEGEGFELDDIEARLHVDASDVLLPDGTDLGPFRIDSLVVAMQDGERRLSLESDVADLEVIGEWRFSTLLPTLSTGFEKLIDYVARKSAYRSEDLELLTEDLDISGIPESIYATYRIVPKDLRIVESFVPNLDLEFVGELSGNITGTTDLLALSALGRIDRLPRHIRRLNHISNRQCISNRDTI